MKTVLICMIFLATLTSVYSQHKYLNNSGIVVVVHPISGSILASRYLADPNVDLNNLNITIVTYRELDADGGAIRTFDFETGEPTSYTYTVKEEVGVSVEYNQTADIVTLTTELKGINATVQSKTHLLTGRGHVSLSGEAVWAYSGRVYYKHTITKWPFCNPCNVNGLDRFGKYLEVSFKVRGRIFPLYRHINTMSKNIAAYDVGDGGYVFLSKKIQVDGNFVDFERGYPFLEDEDDITIRMPKFSASASFEALIRPGSVYDVPMEPQCQPAPEINGDGAVDININFNT